MDFAVSPDRSFLCYVYKADRSRGVFFGDNPFKFPTSVLLAQLSLSSLVTSILQHLLTPLGESAFVSQILAGIILGPTFVGRIKSFGDLVFPVQSLYVSQTVAFFGLMLFLFIVGLKMDLTIVTRSGKRSVVIGICTFFFPLILNILMSLAVIHSIPMDPTLHNTLTWVAAFQSLSSFHVIACLVGDLKLLNSELGRIAVPSSMISGICTWVWVVIVFTTNESSVGHQDTFLMLCLFVGCMILVVIYILRPIMFWMVRKTTNEKAVSENYIFGVFVMVLGSSIFGEIIGQHFLFGPMIMGLAVPDGPPLGSALENKLESLVSTILLPIYFVAVGANIDFSLIHSRNFVIVFSLAFFGFLWKLMGTMLPSLYCKMPFNDALALGLIMSVQGITDVLILGRALEIHLVTEESYGIMVISIVLISAIVSPIVKALYKPSKSYVAYRRRTIQHTKPNIEIRMLACIHHQEHTPCIINLLEASNPTSKSPICFYVAHLIELLGRAAPLLVAHHPGRRTSSYSNQSDHIINAFKLYEQQNPSSVMVNLFTAISPYATMHDEVCALALDKRVSMILVPFHKLWTIHESDEASNSVRAMNRNILKKAPCSVAILVNRGTLTSAARSRNSSTIFNIGMIFVGGQDDREALAYAIRMSKHPNVRLTLIRFIEADRKRKNSTYMDQDFEMINEFRTTNMNSDRCFYIEEVVNDTVGVVSVIHRVENSFDLIMVGRRHATDSPLWVGLSDWNEFPELGFIGDMLASSDSNCHVSVLVVQQQAFAGGELLDSPKSVVENSSAVVDLPWDSVKVYPIH